MTTKNDGGPAFPTTDQNYEQKWSGAGLSLRDYFAGKALESGEASNWRDNQFKPRDSFSIIQNTAFAAYEFADAMLTARDAA